MDKTTELEIAKENIEHMNKMITMVSREVARTICQVHNQSCQRFLEFIDNEHILTCDNCESYYSCDCKEMSFEEARLSNKIADLKSAIKLYEEKTA